MIIRPHLITICDWEVRCVPSFISGELRFVPTKPTTVKSPFAEGQYGTCNTTSGKVCDTFGTEITQSMRWLGYGLDDKGIRIRLPMKEEVSLLTEKSRVDSQQGYRRLPSPQRQDLFWVPSSPLPNGFWRVFFPRKRSDWGVTTHIRDVTEDNNAWNYITIFF